MSASDLDELLREHARRWSARQPAPPPLADAVDHARAARRPRNTAWLSIVVSVLVVAAIAAVPLLRSLSTGHDAAPASPSAATVAKLSQLARTAAAANGEARSADAVLTTYLVAERAVLGGSRSYDVPDDTPVWVIQIEGTFTCAACPRPPQARAPSGNVITLIVDATTFRSHDFSMGGPVQDLRALGRVVRLWP